ncbi:hypothetical protein [Serinibacter salmoneus]|uniref:Uncharacterized protein n=1 Tax=Serinibacter salmoneus TaxID=556530 RepID=A0A2A9D2N5_9MICO|nr:hypothetical protein [Serinibacter salmoneus]PFG20968.1 hypothetical protein ATL40_2587 [Serinibacter salmoneus]
MTSHLHPPLDGRRHLLRRDRATFLEAVTVLAGERWSDSPSGTDPVIAALARSVNALVSNPARERLTPLVPLAVGLRSDEPHWNAWLSLRVIGEVLPTAPEVRQRSLAVGVLAAARTLRGSEHDGAAHRGPVVDSQGLTPGARAAAEQVPAALRWAREFISSNADGHASGSEPYGTDAASRVMENAAHAIVESTAHDPDGELIRLLAGTLVAARAWAGLPEDAADLLDYTW